MSKAHLYGLTADGQSVPLIVDSLGNISGAGGGASTGGGSSSTDVGGWSYAAASGGVTGTSDVTLAAAPGANKHNYITSLQVINKSATTGTEVVIKSGSTILHRLWAGEGGNGYIIDFKRPLVAALNTALTAACITTGTATYINAQGYVSGPPNQAAVTLTPEIEITDYLGDLITTDAGVQIVLAA